MDARERDAARQRIYAMVDSIPPGRVATYGQIADEAGLPRRARLVGRALRDLPEGSELPWHRVVGAGGWIRFRAGAGPGVQGRRLKAEGVAVDGRGRVDMRRFSWQPEW